MSKLSYNGAAFVSNTEKTELMDIISKFQSKVNIPLNIEETTFKAYDMYEPELDGKQTGIKINGTEFRKEPCVESWSGYINRVKGYLFNLLLES